MLPIIFVLSGINCFIGEKMSKTAKSKSKKTLCPQCKLPVVDIGICCDQCNEWFDLGCANIDKVFYDYLSSNDSVCWYCQSCAPNKSNLVHTVKTLLKEQLNEALGEFRSKLFEELKVYTNVTVDAAISPLMLTVTSLQAKLEEDYLSTIKEPLNLLDVRVAKIEDSSLRVDVESLQRRVEQIEATRSHANHLNNATSTTIDRLDWHNRRHDIIFNGVPPSIDLKDFTIKISSKLGLDIMPDDIIFCSRLRKFAGTAVVQFASIGIRDRIMAKYFANCDLTLSQVIGGDVSSRIYLNDNLPPHLLALKRYCLLLKKNRRLLRVIVSNMHVRIVTPEGKQHTVTTQEEVDLVVNKSV